MTVQIFWLNWTKSVKFKIIYTKFVFDARSAEQINHLIRNNVLLPEIYSNTYHNIPKLNLIE